MFVGVSYRNRVTQKTAAPLKSSPYYERQLMNNSNI